MDIKSITIKHLKTSRKLSKTIRLIERVSQLSDACKDFDSSLYSEINICEILSEIFWMKKMQN